MLKIEWGWVQLEGYPALVEVVELMHREMCELERRLAVLEGAAATGCGGGTGSGIGCRREVVAELGGGWRVERAEEQGR